MLTFNPMMSADAKRTRRKRAFGAVACASMLFGVVACQAIAGSLTIDNKDPGVDPSERQTRQDATPADAGAEASGPLPSLCPVLLTGCRPDDLAACSVGDAGTDAADAAVEASEAGVRDLAPVSDAAIDASEEADASKDGASDAAVIDGSGDAGATLGLTCRVTKRDLVPITSCQRVGLVEEGAECNSTSDCASAMDCVSDEREPGRMRCRRYCCGGNDSNVCREIGGRICDQRENTNGLAVPVCVPLASCTLLDVESCTRGQQCTLLRDQEQSSTLTACVQIGTANEGVVCDLGQCAAGLACIGSGAVRSCRKLCRVGSAVGSEGGCSQGKTCLGGPPLFFDNKVGLCVTDEGVPRQ
jgi:hypothetical protein